MRRKDTRCTEMNRKYRILVISVGMLLGITAATQFVAYHHPGTTCVRTETVDDPYCDAKDLLWHGEVYDDERAESVAVETPDESVESVAASEPELIEVEHEPPPPPPNITEVTILNEEKSPPENIDMIRVRVRNKGGPEKGTIEIPGYAEKREKLHEGDTIAMMRGEAKPATKRGELVRYSVEVRIDGEVVGTDTKPVR